MILTPEQGESFTESARPLMKWVSENCDPHVTVHVDYARAELFIGCNNYVTEDFVLD